MVKSMPLAVFGLSDSLALYRERTAASLNRAEETANLRR
jgi:hypothetical protein